MPTTPDPAREVEDIGRPGMQGGPVWIAGWSLWVIAGVLFLVVSWLSWDQIEEDAFIYYRVAANLAAGEGFAFNAGEPPVECSSSLTYQLLLVPLARLPVDLVTSSKLLGIALAMLALLLTGLLAMRLTGDRLVAGLAPLILASCLPFNQWSQRGMETPWYVVVLLGAVLCATHPRGRRWWFLPGFLIVCTRPEGGLILLGFLLVLWTQRRSIAGFWRGVVILAVLCGLLILVRVFYFHDFLPHPFYTKFQGDPEPTGGVALWTFLKHGDVLWVALPGLVMALVRRTWSRDLLLVAGMLAVTLVWSVLGEDWKPYNRHLVPALPFLALVLAEAVHRHARGRGLRLVLVVYFLGASTWMMWHGRGVYYHSHTWANPVSSRALAAPATIWPKRTPASDRIGVNFWATTGQFLARNYPAGITVLYDQMGQTPWYAGPDKTFLDSLGLVNRTVGLGVFNEHKTTGALGVYGRVSRRILEELWPDEPRGGRLTRAVDHLFERDPELILIHEGLLRNEDSVQARLHRDPRLKERYRPRYLVNRAVHIFERRDLPAIERPSVPAGCRVKTISQAGSAVRAR